MGIHSSIFGESMSIYKNTSNIYKYKLKEKFGKILTSISSMNFMKPGLLDYFRRIAKFIHDIDKMKC